MRRNALTLRAQIEASDLLEEEDEQTRVVENGGCIANSAVFDGGKRKGETEETEQGRTVYRLDRDNDDVTHRWQTGLLASHSLKMCVCLSQSLLAFRR